MPETLITEQRTKLEPETMAGNALFQRLDALFAALPKVVCKGECQQACGPISFLPIETENIRRRGFALPTVTDHPVEGPLTCSALGSTGEDRGRCTIYEARPFICRIFGVSRTLKCHRGCQPERFVGPVERERIQTELKAISIALCGNMDRQATATDRQIGNFVQSLMDGRLHLGK